ARRLGRNDDAVDLLGKAAQVAPADAVIQHHLGEACLTAGDVERAAAALRSAIAVRPDLPQPHANLGLVHARAGRLDEAIACFETALSLGLGVPKLHHDLAVALLKRERFTEAA